MKLGIINGWDEASFRYVAELGLHAVEFCCNHNYDSMEVAGHTDNGMLSIEPHSNHWMGTRGQWGVEFTIKFITPLIMPEDYTYNGSPYMP